MPQVLGTTKSIWGFEPRSIAGCLLWFDASDANTTGGGSTVSTWKDKSGFGSNATANSAITLTQNAINGLAALSLNASTPQWLLGSTSITGSTLTVVSLFTMASGSGAAARIIALGAPGANDYNNPSYVGILRQNGTTMGPDRNTAWLPGMFPYSTPTINASVFDGKNAYLYTNGQAQGSYASAGNFTVSSYAIGANTNTADAHYFTGYIGEIIVYNSALTTSQRQEVEGYLAWKWGLAVYPSPVYTSLRHTGSDQTYTVPTGVTQLYVYMWGAGGGSAVAGQGNGRGGSGAYIQGILTTTPGETLTIIVGGGGGRGGRTDTAPYGGGGQGNHGGGTYSGGPATDGGNGSAGGGRSAIRRSGTEIVTVGAGGGAGYNQGGAAAWTGTASAGSTTNAGKGGTPSAGGAYGTGGVPLSFGVGTAGSQFQGGYGNNYGGGGGGGWYGGGGGATQGNLGGDGGGGSSYTTNLASATGSNGGATGASSGNSFFFYVLGVAEGGNASYTQAGGNGLVVLSTTSLAAVSGTRLPIGHPFYDARPFLRTFVPTDIPGCALWLDGSDLSTMTFSSGSNLASLKDKTYNALTATTFSNSVAAPTYSNGSVALVAGNGLTVSSFSLTPSMTVFYVGRASNQATNIPPVEWGSNVTTAVGFLLQSAASNYVLNAGSLYANFLFTTFFANTGSIPNSSGPTLAGGSGTNWGALIQSAQALNPINFGNNVGYYPAGAYNYSALTTGFVYSATSGTIQFQGTTDDGLIVNFNGTNVINQYQQQGATTYYSASLTLPAGYTPIRITWYDTGGGGQYQISYSINGGAYTNDGTGRFYHLTTATY